ncbi:MAG TPA: lysozyme inhibitor LprI family protein [Phenylobacterium sp.]|uniref:lysozyme inhibitor LprI family protein n=1 Tax=Phenylobacterium sp. TaxID=1871053 RepID=UPI002C5B3402|nr:lysozyme inhibitor LprI family protein [Phenylobacterium sp.]HSV01699.1 lysozyme inhibitor LprI family protein [Phenylobacterium sp.]
MVQDEMDETAEAAVPRHRYLLLGGVACACALGVGLGLWARPAIGERGEAPKLAAAPEAPSVGQRKLQIVFDDTPAPLGKPLEVMTPRSGAASAGPPRSLSVALPERPPSPEPPGARDRPPGGLMRADAPRLAEPVLGDRAPEPSFAERARPLAHGLIASAEAALLRIAEIRPDPQPSAAGPRAESAAHSVGAPKPAAARKPPDPVEIAEQRRRIAAERLARLETRKAARAEARAEQAARLEAVAEARAEKLAARAEAARKAERLTEKARAEALAKAERRKAERLAVQERAHETSAALAEARAAARAQAVAQARAKTATLAKAEARRKKGLAILAHVLAKVARQHAKPAPEPPPRPLKGTASIRLASAPRCVSADPGEALACADPQLSSAERRMNRAYQQAEAAGVPPAELRRQQQRWVAARAAAAREAPWAVRDVYQARIAELEDLARNPHD